MFPSNEIDRGTGVCGMLELNQHNWFIINWNLLHVWRFMISSDIKFSSVKFFYNFGCGFCLLRKEFSVFLFSVLHWIIIEVINWVTKFWLWWKNSSAYIVYQYWTEIFLCKWQFVCKLLCGTFFKFRMNDVKSTLVFTWSWTLNSAKLNLTNFFFIKDFKKSQIFQTQEELAGIFTNLSIKLETKTL